MNEVRAEVTIGATPDEAFDLFTRDVDRWWRRGDRYGGSDVLGHRFEPWVGGRFLEVLAEREAALGQITVWDPPGRLVFSWRQGNWAAQELTHVEVTFAASGAGTRVVLRHYGFDSVASQVGCEVGYQAGWAELLGWFAQQTIQHA